MKSKSTLCSVCIWHYISLVPHMEIWRSSILFLVHCTFTSASSDMTYVEMRAQRRTALLPDKDDTLGIHLSPVLVLALGRSNSALAHLFASPLPATRQLPRREVQGQLTDNNLPRNILSFRTSAFCTIDGSPNSTYAYLGNISSLYGAIGEQGAFGLTLWDVR